MGLPAGVQLLDNGRVASIVISGFGANGIVPDAIGQLTELRILNLGAHDELVGGHLFKDVTYNMTQEQRLKIRMDYEQKFLYRDVREGLSDILIDGINANPNFKPIVKSNRIDKKDVQFGNLTNKITGISKALMRCTKLENFFIANSPIVADNFCTNWWMMPVYRLTAKHLKKRRKNGAGTTSPCLPTWRFTTARS